MLLKLFIAFLSILYVVAQMKKNSYLPPTDCVKFLNNTQFDPESVLGINWRVFYLWNPYAEASHNLMFRKPSKVLTDRFKVELDDVIKPKLNWTEADLFMETTIDYCALFFKTNVSGLFRIIPSIMFHYREMPMLMFALKVVGPGYLGLVNCNQSVAFGFAPFNKMPKENEIDEAVKLIGYQGMFNQSYIEIERKDNPYKIPEDSTDTEDNYIDVELLDDSDKLLF